MAIPIINNWESYYPIAHEGLGSSYERIILNKLLDEIRQEYEIERALESPCFGFTGITGINLVEYAKAGVEIWLEDDSEPRLGYIKNTWRKLDLPVNLRLNEGFKRLDYNDDYFDFSFNFSALWFVESLPIYLSELVRVTKGPILICLPNRAGLGYKGQLKGYSKKKYPFLKPEHIDPGSLISLMKKAGRVLTESDFIDCPPWPDIGMNKEDWLKGLLKKKTLAEPKEIDAEKALSIMPYYLDEDPGFADRLLRYGWLEKTAPQSFKRIWAHHKYYLFA